MTTENEKCFICECSIVSGYVEVKEKGIEKLENASIARKDRKYVQLEGIKTLKVHVSCRKAYTRANSIKAEIKKTNAEKNCGDLSTEGRLESLRSSGPPFDFATQCFYCTEKIDEEFYRKERKEPLVKRKIACKVSLLLMKDTDVEESIHQEHLLEDPEADPGDELNEIGASFPTVESPPVHFATENSSEVTSQTGSTALVPCVVNNIGDGMVSWIRRKDYHLLTVGLATYSSDDRFQAIHLQHSGDWTLQIKYVQIRDAGIYECQVSSHPPTSIFINLIVIEARAEIEGPSEKYLKPGSGLRLQCNVLQSTEPPLYVFWYHNNRMINYDVDRGINVTTTLAEKTSVLTITNAATLHSGNYSCVPSNAQPASTYVHILNGENPAAMQHGARGLSWLQCSPSSWLLVLSIVNMMC